FDNRHIVPYNRYLLLLLNAHINLEICGYVQAVKYLYKYVYKGPDRASLRLLQHSDALRHDEIRAHLDARFVCSPEGVHHIFEYDCQFKSDTVYRLQVHLPGLQTVTFESGEEREALERERNRDTTLTAWFKLNIEYCRMESENTAFPGTIDPRTLYYYHIPKHFTFVKSTRKWKVRGRGNRQIGRMFMATPRDHERFCLRLLLLHRKNMHSFEDLRTVNNILHPTFSDAARALALLHDDEHYVRCLEEAAHFQIPAELRALFSYIGSTQSDGEVLAYYDLHDRLAILQYDLPTRIVPPAQGRPDSTSIPIDHEWHSRKGTELYQRLNQQQQSAADCILASLDSARCKMHYVDGP
ncbi:hypothetical protein ANCDUO_21699, partial [Ancylostoma duodenale]